AEFGVPPIKTIEPNCPGLASHLHIRGVVVLKATVGKDGTVEEIRYISGHPLLTASAIDALKQWTWRPFLLNGRPVRAVSNISVRLACNQR
ncbi:MAG TPA: energy transducer TonB, partial [Terriglobales bacterium]|nr:energy transducer TonB [Terriglobales bacterium]